MIIAQVRCFVKTARLFQARLNHQQHNHMRRIVDIKEPAVQIFVPDIRALSVIHRDWYEREKSTILKKKPSETLTERFRELAVIQFQ